MKQVFLTCPFTGVTFEATEFNNGSLLVINPLTGGKIMVFYDLELNDYCIPVKDFLTRPTMKLSEAASELKVSRQYMTKLCRSGKIQAHELPNGEKRVLVSDVLEYQLNRKEG